MLGKREPDIYGAGTLEQLEENVMKIGSGIGLDVVCMQSNYEGALIDEIQQGKLVGFKAFLLIQGH